ncbi:MAG: 30S ribosomal protein S5 [Patescibacteria group bacterium]|jgi:small subunit ribosomal protein S5|nr:30S ribosomal protein S5 [bacterium]HQC49960.1 30S ribosomal protein S5 [bacterium]
MSEDKKIAKNKVEQDTPSTGAAKTVAKDVFGEKKRSFRGRRGDRRDDRRDEFEQRILEVARVTRVMAGGKRMNFRACVAIGDKKGNVGVGLGKGADVTIAVNKAVNKAKKAMINVPIVRDTIPHEVYHKKGAAKILIKPARKGSGVISGGVTRVIFELAGVKNATTKTLGTNNKVNNARCTIEALTMLRRVEKKADKGSNQVESTKEAKGNKEGKEKKVAEETGKVKK